jgi:hypothetical protein
MGGYRDILRGPQLKAEYDDYIAYTQKTRAQKQQAYAALNVQKFTYASQIVWIYPFRQDARGVAVEVEQIKSEQPTPGPTALELASDYFVTTKPANTVTILDRTVFPKGKLAKMIVKLRVTAATSNSQSRITGRSYKRHQTNSVSVFLGKNTDTSDYFQVVKAIRTDPDYENFVIVKGNTVTFVPEG